MLCGLIDGFAERVEVFAGFNNSCGNARRTLFEVGTGIVNLFNADFAVDFKDSVIVLEDVIRNGTGERILRVGVDVHFEAFPEFLRGSNQNRRGIRS